MSQKDRMHPVLAGVALSYLILLSLFLLYSVVVLASAHPGQNVGYLWISHFLWKHDLILHVDARLLLLVLVAGALGGSLHALRSAYSYIGARQLYPSWIPMYLVLPITGSVLSAGFYFLIRGGIMGTAVLTTAQSKAGTAATASSIELNIYTFCAMAFLVGLFHDKAMGRLAEVAENMFGKDKRIGALQQDEETPPEADFDIKAMPPESAPANPGDDVTYDITVTATGSFDSPVDLSVVGQPENTQPPVIKPLPLKLASEPQTAKLTISTAGALGGRYTIKITGCANGGTSEASVVLNVPKPE